MELAALDLHYAVRELSQLIGAKVEKAFQSDVDKRDVLFVLYLQGVPKQHLRFVLPGIVCVSTEKTSYPKEPPGFAMFLRKHLGGARIESVEQVGFDRILRIGFDNRGTKTTLVAELMPPGNLLLLDADGKIINLLEQATYKDRQLRARQPYVEPPTSADIPKLSDEELAARITTSTTQVVVTLASALQLGGVYAEEACARAGIQKSRSDLSHAEILTLVRAARTLLEEPIVAHHDDKRAYPFALKARTVTPCEQTSFLAAIAQFAPQEPILDKVEQRAKVRSSPETKLQALINAQTTTMTRLEMEAVRLQHVGELLYTNYGAVDAVLKTAQAARASKLDIETSLGAFPIVRKYDPAAGTIEIELEDA